MCVDGSRPNLSAPGFRLTDRTLGVLLQAGLPPGEALEFVNAAAEFVLGLALTESAPGYAEGEADADHILAAVDRVQAVENFPHLVRVLQQTDLSELTQERIFEAGLETLRRGLEQRLDELGQL